MEYYSTLKKNEIVIEGKWLELEIIMLDGIRQPQKDK
jgi:hypothetical protein